MSVCSPISPAERCRIGLQAGAVDRPGWPATEPARAGTQDMLRSRKRRKRSPAPRRLLTNVRPKPQPGSILYHAGARNAREPDAPQRARRGRPGFRSSAAALISRPPRAGRARAGRRVAPCRPGGTCRCAPLSSAPALRSRGPSRHPSPLHSRSGGSTTASARKRLPLRLVPDRAERDCKGRRIRARVAGPPSREPSGCPWSWAAPCVRSVCPQSRSPGRS